MPIAPPSSDNAYHPGLAALIAESHRRVVGSELLPPGAGLAERLFHTPFVVVAHGTQRDPVFFYGNAMALRRFGMSWEEFTQLPSHRSAEPVNREERARLLARVTEHGYIGDYAGIRIAKDGARFRIENATVWNLIDETGAYHGQAARFEHWTDL